MSWIKENWEIILIMFAIVILCSGVAFIMVQGLNYVQVHGLKGVVMGIWNGQTK